MKGTVCLLFSIVCLFAPVHMGPSSGFERIPDYIPSEWGDMTDEEIQQKAETDNLYTGWMNTDDSTYGTGDFENVKKLYKANTFKDCPMKCDDPVGVEWRLADDEFEDRIDQCVILTPDDFGRIARMTWPGFNCLDAYQIRSTCSDEECRAIGMHKGKRTMGCDHCPDFEVRYICPNDVDTYSCPPNFKRFLEGELEELDQVMEAKEKELRELSERANNLENEKKRELSPKVAKEAKEAKLEDLLRKLLNQ